MILGIFRDWAQLIEIAGVWLAAFATFAATFAALKVAAQSTAQSVSVFAQPMLALYGNKAIPATPVFSITATNQGMRSVTITHICIQCKYPRYQAILMPGMPGSSGLPVTISDGETANWRFDEILPTGENWYSGIAKHFKDFNALKRWLATRNLRFYVATSLGNDFFAPRSDEFRRKLREQILEERKS